VVGVVVLVTSPWLGDVTKSGVLDWDVETAHRYLVTLSLRRYGEMPFWNPFACGGFPAWGYIEGAPTLVSPWLLPYLALPIMAAVRLEVIGMGLLGAVGAYAMAGQLTRSAPARALVVALWAVNGRWALQAAAGHTWHLAYALMPWCFYFFERARADRGRFAPLFGLAVMFAMLVYGGGIYPLPHTVLALGLYALTLVVLERSPSPLAPLVISGGLAFGLAAPKLWPMLVTFARSPRLVDSTEWLDVHAFLTLLTSRDQGMTSSPVHLPYGWHENGMYISVVGVVVLVVACACVWGRRESALKLVGLVFVALGFGAFGRMAPWSLLHAHAPFFGSQHVPTRFLYPAVLLLSVVAASGLGRVLERWPRLEIVAAVVVLGLAVDVARVARVPMTQTMKLAPAAIDADPVFHFDETAHNAVHDRRLQASGYLAMRSNRGVIACYGVPTLAAIGARSVTDPRYRGEAYVETMNAGDTPVAARIVEWSPNHAVVTLDAAAPGSFVVYNMNFDQGWRSDAGPVVSRDDKVAVRMDEPRARVTFTYRPPYFTAGLLVCILTLAASAAVFWRERARRSSPPARASA
jgi:hypothetical protein